MIHVAKICAVSGPRIVLHMLQGEGLCPTWSLTFLKKGLRFSLVGGAMLVLLVRGFPRLSLSSPRLLSTPFWSASTPGGGGGGGEYTVSNHLQLCIAVTAVSMEYSRTCPEWLSPWP